MMSPTQLTARGLLLATFWGFCAADVGATALPGWKLAWQDEFEGDEVDTSEWNVLAKLHSHNNEKQAYLPQQAAIFDGKLQITAVEEFFRGQNYLSARLESRKTHGPGRFEARIDLPTSQGMWPAFWLLPNAVQWPTGGEIDIMENKGNDPFTVSSAYHWQIEPGTCCHNHRFSSGFHLAIDEEGPVDFHSGFHRYAAEWESDEIRFYVDDELHTTITETAERPIFEGPMNIILNLAVGGFFGGDPDASTLFPQVMEVDYVRVWTAIPEPSTALMLAMGLLGVRPVRKQRDC